MLNKLLESQKYIISQHEGNLNFILANRTEDTFIYLPAPYSGIRFSFFIGDEYSLTLNTNHEEFFFWHKEESRRIILPGSEDVIGSTLTLTVTLGKWFAELSSNSDTKLLFFKE